MKLTNKKGMLAILMACLLLLGTFLTACGEKDPVEYAKNVEKEAINTVVEGVVDAYDAYIAAAKTLETQGFKTAGKMNLDIEISESALSMLEVAFAASGAELDLSWLSNISLDSDIYMDEELYGYGFMLGLGDSDLIGIDSIVNLKDGIVYLGIPEILSKYLSVDFGSLMEDADTVMNLGALLEMPDFSKLPEGEMLKALLNKYIDIVLNGIKTVEIADGIATAEGVESSCKVLIITITESDAMAITEALLTEARNDKALEEVVVAFIDFIADYMNEIYYGIYGEALPPIETVPSGAEAYAELCDAIDEALADLEEAKAETAADDAEEETLILNTYVNRDDEVIGRTLVLPDGTEAISYVYSENKDNFGFVFYAEGELVLCGSGTKGKTLNGTFTIMPSGEEAVSFTVKDLDIDKLEEGLFSGTIDINAERFAENYDDSVLSSVLGNYTVRIEIKQTDMAVAEMTMSLIDAEDNCFVKFIYEIVVDMEAEAPNIPASEDVIVIDPKMDETATEQTVMDLFTSIDVDVIKERLNASPIPKEYVELIEQYLAYIDLIQAYQTLPQ